MQTSKPLEKPKSEYSDLINKISHVDSPVGIDAQYTHAVIIEYLQRLEKRMETLERLIMDDKSKRIPS